VAFLIDPHAHTAPSPGCSQITASGLIEPAIEAGLDGVAATEHQKVEFGYKVAIYHKKIAKPEADGSEEG
jgi:predicted metal-dependent phosphoesterase TrpH